MPKFYAIRLSTTVVIQAEGDDLDDSNVITAGRALQQVISSENVMDVDVLCEVRDERDLWRYGWALTDVPYGAQEELRYLLPAYEADEVSDLLALVGIDAPREVVATWSSEDRDAAADWASATHLAASDNDNDVPPRPAFLPEPWTGPTQGEGIWETNPTPMVAKAPAPAPNPIPNPAFGAPKPKNHNPKG